MKVTKKEIKKIVESGKAIDITHTSNIELRKLKENDLEMIAFSIGTYGINSALFEDKKGNKYAITAIASSLFSLI